MLAGAIQICSACHDNKGLGADKRSGDIYRFPLLFLDDMEKIDPRIIQVLKSLVTSEQFRRPRLGTSMSTTVPQKTTLIGTANTACGSPAPMRGAPG